MTVTLTGAGPVSDGADYVLPYQISIDGQGPFNVDCYDFFDSVSIGQSWLANVLDLQQAADSGAFSGSTGHGVGANALADYEEVAWLSSQATPTPQTQIDLQHAIWNVFDPGTFTITAGMQQVLDGLASAQASNYNGFSFNNFIFLEATTGVPGDGSFPQAFILDGGGNTTGITPSPEPGTVIFLGIGMAAILLSSKLKWPNCRSKTSI